MNSYKIIEQNQAYFLTFTITKWIDIFTRKEYKIIITDSLNHCIMNKGVEVFGWVLMTNHLHLIARVNQPYLMTNFIRDFKKFTSKEIAKQLDLSNESRRDWLKDKFDFEARCTGRAEKYKIWQDSYHAVLLDNHERTIQRLNYIHQNPVRQMIVQEPHEYLFSSALDYTGVKGLVDVSLI